MSTAVFGLANKGIRPIRSSEFMDGQTASDQIFSFFPSCSRRRENDVIPTTYVVATSYMEALRNETPEIRIF